MKKLFIFISLVSFINAQPKCVDTIDAKLNQYIIQRKHFIRDGECFDTSETSILKNIETNETLELDGVVNGIQQLINNNLLLISTFDGIINKHTFNFFIIENNTSLSSVEGGIIGSSYIEPSIIINSNDDEIIVINREYIRKNNILGIRKVKYKYIRKLKKFKKLKEEKIFPSLKLH